MHGSILLVTMPPPPRQTPGGFAFFFFFGGLFPIPGHAERGNSPPPSSRSTSHMFFATSFLSEQRQKDTFSQLLCMFSWDYWEKDNGCHNVAKKWTINLKTKTKEKNSLKSASLVELHKNTGPNLCFSTYIKSLFHLNYHYLKLSWRNISVLPFQKLRSTRERIIRTFVSNFKTSH